MSTSVHIHLLPVTNLENHLREHALAHPTRLCEEAVPIKHLDTVVPIEADVGGREIAEDNVVGVEVLKDVHDDERHLETLGKVLTVSDLRGRVYKATGARGDVLGRNAFPEVQLKPRLPPVYDHADLAQ